MNIPDFQSMGIGNDSTVICEQQGQACWSRQDGVPRVAGTVTAGSVFVHVQQMDAATRCGNIDASQKRDKTIIDDVARRIWKSFGTR